VIAYVFPGQGTQRRYVGTDLFERYPEQVRVADAVLGYPIKELWTSGDGRLDRTDYTQPAVFVANALAHAELVGRTGLTPDVVLGHSLGELNALHAAGVFDLETGVRLAQRRGELMARLGDPGTMAALRGDRDRLLAMLESSSTGAHLAADNSPREIVVAGGYEAVTTICSQVDRAELGTAVPLPVSGPFHTPLLRRAREAFAAYLAGVPLREPRLPVIANVSGCPYQVGQAAELLADQLVRPVRWFDSVRHLLAEGPLLYQEVGPSRSLSALIREISTADLQRPPEPRPASRSARCSSD
jgi:malonyl CoA-acyl carrier protein transacylase